MGDPHAVTIFFFYQTEKFNCFDKNEIIWIVDLWPTVKCETIWAISEKGKKKKEKGERESKSWKIFSETNHQ